MASTGIKKFSFLSVVSLLFTVSCTGTPSYEKVNLARYALDSARTAGAETCASREFTRAEEHYWLAINAISDAKMSLYHSRKQINRANRHLDSVIILANKASAIVFSENGRNQSKQSLGGKTEDTVRRE